MIFGCHSYLLDHDFQVTDPCGLEVAFALRVMFFQELVWTTQWWSKGILVVILGHVGKAPFLSMSSLCSARNS